MVAEWPRTLGTQHCGDWLRRIDAKNDQLLTRPEQE